MNGLNKATALTCTVILDFKKFKLFSLIKQNICEKNMILLAFRLNWEKNDT